MLKYSWVLNMNVRKDKYVIIEIIPTTSSKDTGEIAQISALKLEGLILKDRFDYRIEEDKILIPDILRITSYDKEQFKYLKTTNDLLNEFEKWSENLPILILDNNYTKDYLRDIQNKKISICDILKIQYSDNIIEKLMDIYQLEPSNYIVDLLYESILKSDLNRD